MFAHGFYQAAACFIQYPHMFEPFMATERPHPLLHTGVFDSEVNETRARTMFQVKMHAELSPVYTRLPRDDKVGGSLCVGVFVCEGVVCVHRFCSASGVHDQRSLDGSFMENNVGFQGKTVCVYVCVHAK